MKRLASFSLKTLLAFTLGGTLLAVIAVLTGLALYISHSRSELAELTQAVRAAKEARFNTAQVQQFITDASVTAEADGLKEAEEQLESAKKNLATLSTLAPERQKEIQTVTGELVQLHTVGVEMAKTYWDKGRDAGNVIMKRPGTGVDAISETVEKKLNALVAFFDDEFAKKNAESDRAITLFAISAVIGLVIFLVFMMRVILLRIAPLNEVARKLSEDSDGLHGISKQISSLSQNLSQSSSSQASAVEETVTAINEIDAMAKSTHTNSTQLGETAQVSHEAAAQGHQAMREMTSAIDAISDSNEKILSQVEATNHRIQDIVKMIGEIGDKTKVINDIVFQTKLLSFNASVEAARSGEHGKGFAVVAEEVGNLAQMSGNAAKEISDLLQQSSQRVEAIVRESSAQIAALVSSGKSTTEEGRRLATRCATALENILAQVDSVQGKATEMARAVDEQQKGITEITKALDLISNGSHQNVNSSKSAASQASDLLDKSVTLRQATEQMEVLILGE